LTKRLFCAISGLDEAFDFLPTGREVCIHPHRRDLGDVCQDAQIQEWGAAKGEDGVEDVVDG